MDDFAMYKPLSQDGTPAGHYGSAVLALIEAKRFPSWALFCYRELVASADHGYTPTVAALLSEDAILLHPVKTEGGYKGLLIAREAAGDQTVYFESTTGEIVALDVPTIETKVIAQEDVVLLRP